MGGTVLCVCLNANVRSPFLAYYLKAKGYETGYAALSPLIESEGLTQKRIDESAVVISVDSDVIGSLKEQFQLKGKPLIELEVQDMGLAPFRPLKKVHSELEAQIQKYLPQIQQVLSE